MRKVNWKRWGKIAAVILAADLFISAVWVGRILVLAMDYELYPADWGIVLMGDSAKHYTDLGKQTHQRLNHALELYRQGYFKEFLLVGGSRPRHHYSGAQLMRTYLVNKGVPPEKIFLEQKSYDTLTNLSFTEEILRSRRVMKVILISSPLHIHRIEALGDSRFLVGRFTFYSPHPFFGADPPYNAWEMWKAVHYEWVAFALRRLPQPWYEALVKRLRGQEPWL